MRGRHFLVVWALVFGAMRAVSAQTSDPASGGFHCPKPTTIMTFSTGAQLIALRSIDHGCAFKFGNQELEFYSAMLEPKGLADPANRAKAESLWPLTVGKVVEFNDDPGMMTTLTRQVYVSRKITLTVVSHEPINIKAGRFDVYAIDVRLEATVNISSRADFVRVIRYYYAPVVGMFVRAEIREGLEDPPLLMGLASQLQPSSLIRDFEATSISTP